MSMPWATGRLVGAVLWSFATISARANLAGTTNQVWLTGGQLLTAPAIAPDGTIYVGAHGTNFNDIWLISFATNGVENWRTEIWGNRLSASPSVNDDGTIYLGSAQQAHGSEKGIYNYGAFHAVTPDGETNTVRDLNNWCDGTPSIGSDGSVYVGDVYNLRSYSPTGSVNWTLKTLGGWIGAAPAIGTNGYIYVPVLYTFVGNGPGRVYGVTPEGVVTNKWQCEGKVPVSPAIGPDGAIYIGDELNNVYSFSPAGPTNWVITVGGKIQTSAAVGPNDTLYVGCSDGKLYALNTANGGVTQTWQTSGSIRSCPVLG